MAAGTPLPYWDRRSPMPVTGDAEFSRRLDLIEKLLRELPDRLDEKYVDRREYAADQRADGVQLQGLEKEVRALRTEIGELDRDLKAERAAREQDHKEREKEAAAMRRLLYGSFLFPIAVAIVVTILLGGVLR